MIGFGAIGAIISAETMPPAERPIKTSAPTRASANVRQVRVHRKLRLGRVGGGLPVRPDDAVDVHHQDVLVPRPQDPVVAGRGNRRRTGPAEDDPHVLDPLADQFQRIQKSRPRNDRRPMLVVVEDRDVHRRPQPCLDLETFRGFNVFQVDAAKARLHHPDGLYELLHVLRVQFQVNRVQVGEPLEKKRLPFHDRLARQRPDVAQPQYGRAVGDNGHQVAAPGVQESVFGVVSYGKTRDGHARRVGEGQIMLCETRLGRHDLQLPVRGFAVVL